jgi:transcriptional regulator with XRE-family HTH domain
MSVPTTTSRRRRIVRALTRKGYREAYVAQHVKRDLATQIRMMREDRGWTQADLAERIGSRQPAIARLENDDYGQYSLQTLMRLASAFDVALMVRFVPFSELADYTASMTEASLSPPGYDQDLRLREGETQPRPAIEQPGARAG